MRRNMAVKKYEAGNIVIEIDDDKCNGDNACVEQCPVTAFDLADGKSHATRIGDCTECCICIDECPTGAIKHSSC